MTHRARKAVHTRSDIHQCNNWVQPRSTHRSIRTLVVGIHLYGAYAARQRTTITAGARKRGFGDSYRWGTLPAVRRSQGGSKCGRHLVSTSLDVWRLIMAGAVCAQEAPAPGAAPDDALTQVVVTGSRIARSSENAPSPVTTLGSDELQKIAATNIGQVLSELPAFRASTNPSTNGFGSFNVGAQIVNLRGLGVTRTLILLDGRRFAPTTREGSADLNLIPSLLIDRTEMVTGGASGGVRLGRHRGRGEHQPQETTRGDRGPRATTAITNESDGDRYHSPFAGGTPLLDDRGHVDVRRRVREAGGHRQLLRA